MSAKDLARQALRPVSHDGASQLARRGDAEARQVAAVGKRENGHQSAAGAVAVLVDALIICAPGNSLGRSEPLAGLHDGSRSQALSALRAAPLENEPPVLGAHANQKAVRPLAATAIGLKSALHSLRNPLDKVMLSDIDRTSNGNERLPTMSTSVGDV